MIKKTFPSKPADGVFYE